MSHNESGLGRPSSGKRRLKDLLLQSDNRVCADCCAPDPKWASANVGVFICLKCCGVHRSLGTHISKVLSVTLDEWSNDEIDAMIEVGGNASANSIYEAYIPEGVSKPGPDSSHEARSKYIRSKYECQEFLKRSLRILSAPKMSSLQTSLSRKIMSNFRSASSSLNSPMNVKADVSSTYDSSCMSLMSMGPTRKLSNASSSNPLLRRSPIDVDDDELDLNAEEICHFY